MEAVATAWALEFSLEVGINQGILQGDSKVVMKSLADEAQPLASFVRDISNFRAWSCCWSLLGHFPSLDKMAILHHALLLEPKVLLLGYNT